MDASPVVTLSAILSISLALYGVVRSIRYARRGKLPPGPPADPIIGHIRKMPFDYQEKTFQEWGKIYGDVLYVHFLGMSIVVLGSQEAARDLLDKRSAIYSDRPRMVMFRELMGCIHTTSTVPYGDKFRKHRRILQEYMNSRTLVRWHSLQELETATLVQELLKAPGSYRDHFKRFAAGVVMKIAYGHTVTSVDDEYVRLADTANRRLLETGGSGAMIVDLIPILKYVPSWFPGGGFQKECQSVKRDVEAMLDIPYEGVKRAMKSGNVFPSLTSTNIEAYEQDGKLSQTDEDDIKGVAGQLYLAAEDTTSAVLQFFILAMVLNPEIYKRAQEEIDLVIGSKRLPELSDREFCPYLEAVVTETYRWHSPVPLGLPHSVTEDDIYRGYLIPKGTMIMANIWAITQDPEVYPEPERYNPERFLGDNKAPDPREVVFGFGRRSCPGKLFADTSIWLAIASMAATLDISKALDANGKEITPSTEYTSGAISHPKPFECVIKARSEKTWGLVAQTAASRQQ